LSKKVAKKDPAINMQHDGGKALQSLVATANSAWGTPMTVLFEFWILG
jgi:hypothetical protein